SLFICWSSLFCVFFFQAEDGIRVRTVTGVQTCALPILVVGQHALRGRDRHAVDYDDSMTITASQGVLTDNHDGTWSWTQTGEEKIGRASCRERGRVGEGAVAGRGKEE